MEINDEKIRGMVDGFGYSYRAQAILETMLMDLMIYQDMEEPNLETRVRELALIEKRLKRLATALEETYDGRMDRLAKSDRV